MNFVPQTTNYSCACASLATALSVFGVHTSESELMKLLNCKEGMGTDLRVLETYLENQNFEVIRKEGSNHKFESFIELSQLQSQGYQILLEISYDVPHCVVFLRVNPSHVTVYCPFNNKEVSWQKKKFLRGYWFVRTNTISQTVIDEFGLDISFLENTEKGFIAFKPKST